MTTKPRRAATMAAIRAGKSPPRTKDEVSGSALIDEKIASLGDWRGDVLARVRKLIRDADPDVVEAVKWKKPTNPMGVPVWEHDGIICTGETYKSTVKLTFAKGAALDDPSGLFNSSLEGNVRRAIDIGQGEKINEAALKKLIRAAVALNLKGKAPATSKEPKLLSGGNPQIAKGDGEAPVQAYIDAMPGWKRDLGRRIDTLITRAVPGVRKAVKWNSPFYGVEEKTWFMSYHCFAKYVKVAFFRGTSLTPVPPGTSKQKEVRYLDIYENDDLDDAQFTDWVKQASKLPGERM
ncbi:DUF1801 domain-containing protein [Leptospira interrogans]